MGYTYSGDAVLGVSLNVNTPKPLDIRTVVNDIESLYTIPEETAYQGMTVANINDGNLYMLIDKNKIKEKIGWKASYESIQIITCTQEEYDEWNANTLEGYKPSDSSKPYLRRDVYYYIYENEESSQYYVTAKQIEEWLSERASATELSSLSQSYFQHVEKYNEHVENYDNQIEQFNTKIIEIFDNLNNNYITSDSISSIYATKDQLKETNDKFENYYTSDVISELFVTKESLRGEGDLEGDTFAFVTQEQYNQDKESISESFSTSKLLLSEISITTDATSLLVNGNPVAFKKEIPKIITISNEDYKNLVENSTVDSETYYYTYDDNIVGYVTYNTALETFFTKAEVNNLINTLKKDLIDNYIIPLQNEISALKSSGS